MDSPPASSALCSCSLDAIVVRALLFPWSKFVGNQTKFVPNAPKPKAKERREVRKQPTKNNEGCLRLPPIFHFNGIKHI
jgi:hypothetical protein